VAAAQKPAAVFEPGKTLALTPLEVFGGQASQQDLDNMVRVFAAAADRPDLIPQTFLAYVVDYIQTANLQVSVSQITGQTLQLTPAASITAAESLTATTYGDLSTVGPELSGLTSGRYAVLYGAQAKTSATTDEALMSVSINGGAAADDDAAVTANTDLANVFTLSLQVLTADSNTIEAKYRATGGTATFGQRKLIAIRYANL
jgi:hypothetical protein